MTWCWWDDCKLHRSKVVLMAESGFGPFPQGPALQCSAISYMSRLRRLNDGPCGKGPNPGMRDRNNCDRAAFCRKEKGERRKKKNPTNN